MRKLKPFIEALTVLFEGYSRQNFQAKERLLKELSRLDPQKIDIGKDKTSQPVYENHCEEIWQDFLMKIYGGRFYWIPGGASLSAYVKTTLWHQWIDLHRKLEREKNPVLETEGGMDLQNMAAPNLSDEDSIEESMPVKEFRSRVESLLTRQQRVMIKLWIPHLFDCTLEEDDLEYIRSKGGNPGKILSELAGEMKEAREKGKGHISAEVIAKWLNLQRNTVDQNLRRARERLREYTQHE